MPEQAAASQGMANWAGDGRRAAARSWAMALLLAVAVGLLTAAVFSPRLVHWKGLHIREAWYAPEVNRAAATLKQIDQPWARVENPSNRVIQWRLLFPLIWHHGQLPKSWYLAMPHVGCVATLFWLALFLRRRRGSWTSAFLPMLALSSASWFFVSIGWLTYFDSWLALAMLLLTFSPRWWLMALAAGAAPWIDERIVFAVPVIAAARWIDGKMISAAGLPSGADVARASLGWRPWLALLLPITGYVGLRVVALFVADGDSVAVDYKQMMWQQVREVAWWRFVEGWWSGFRAAWLLAGLAVGLAWSRLGPSRLGVVMFGLVIAGASVVAVVIAADMSRSVMILLPAVALGACWAPEHRCSPLRYVLPAVVVMNLLLPASHVLWGFKVPIRYVYAELDRWKDPPPELRPDTYVQRSQPNIIAGNHAQALRDLETALMLDSEFGPAFAHRARLLYRQRRHDLALLDINKAMSIVGRHPDLLLIQAMILHAQGKGAQAREACLEALKIAPENWSGRETFDRLMHDIQAASPQPAGP